MVILLVRHGQTDWNINTLIQGRVDNLLNEKGRNQAAKVGEYLKENDPSWDIAISSPLKRAYETAEIVTSVLNFKGEIITHDDLMEREFGNMDGLPLDAAAYDILESNANPTVETFENLQIRVINVLKEIAKTYNGKRVIVFAHAQVIKAAIAAFDSSFNFRTLLLNSAMNYFEAEVDKNLNVRLKVTKYNIVPEGHQQF